jgi:hypothetical protein
MRPFVQRITSVQSGLAALPPLEAPYAHGVLLLLGAPPGRLSALTKRNGNP